MTYLLAFAFWAAAFVAIGLAVWAYLTVTNLLGLSAAVQGAVFFVLLCGLLAVATARGWNQS